MKSNLFILLRFAIAILTIVVIVGSPYIPPKTLAIHPLSSTSTSINGYYDPEYGASSQWIDESQHYWRCDYKPEFGRSNTCGFSISWGSTFENTASNANNIPSCTTADSDDDGDGWGWENNQSCIVGELSKLPRRTLSPPPSVAAGEPPICDSLDSDEDGDGWGWENEQSCIVVDGHQPKETPSIAGKTHSKDDAPPCEDPKTDLDGDGWGWENEHSCIVKNDSARHQIIRSADFSAFDALNLNIHYEGRANSIRVYLRNFNPAYATAGDSDSAKFMAVTLRTEDLRGGPIYIPLSEFKVTEWWVTERDAPREWAGRELDRIIVLGLDIAEFGVHKVRVDNISLTGDWISRENLLLAIIVFWVFYLLLEAFARYVVLRNESRLSEKKIDQLTGLTQQLEDEKDTLKELSSLDTLTGIYNRIGATPEIEALFNHHSASHPACLLIFDIDHFKRINDIYGHDTGDKILACFADTIKTHISDTSIFARWGGEEFLLIEKDSTPQEARHLAEKLRVLIAKTSLEPIHNIDVTVSIGITSITSTDKFESAFKRADIALYEAKKIRNTVEFKSL
ncbi:diguanylate cyclase domain-containing protein [Teredinibacter purpureus]|uniref:diguanylate cyclase domain-containing protein n=1 Tax=Teredinibacter purpureus TaxID=2731756 RepID=UPI0006968F51|nr:diguanylate cyclase [Teredinibacter purpureus]